MKELDKTKAYDLSNLNDEELEQFRLECLNEGSMDIFKYPYTLKKYKDTHKVYYDKKFTIGWNFSFPEQGNITDAKELFEEWTPKQGDRVWVSYDKNKWFERIFALIYKGRILVENFDENLIQWNYIKKFEEEYRINVGDWVKCTISNSIFKYDKSFTKNDKVKITNPQLIELLEQEFKTK